MAHAHRRREPRDRPATGVGAGALGSSPASATAVSATFGPRRYSRPACWSRAVAVDPSPSSAMVSGAGISVSKGRRGWAVVTPEPRGYSKLSLWARIS